MYSAPLAHARKYTSPILTSEYSGSLQSTRMYDLACERMDMESNISVKPRIIASHTIQTPLASGQQSVIMAQGLWNASCRKRTRTERGPRIAPPQSIELSQSCKVISYVESSLSALQSHILATFWSHSVSDHQPNAYLPRLQGRSSAFWF